jgi:5-methyltetrahydrofolate--homocysteine methyltransferase
LTWELKGKYPAILEDAKLGEAARKLYDDAQRMLDDIVTKGRLTANAVYAFWPAASAGDDIVVFTDDDRTSELARFHTLRQQWQRVGQKEFRALADYIAPQDSQRKDYLGGFAVTTGIGCDELCAEYDADHDDYNSILAKSLADRLAEAFAECLHARVRREWGYGRDEHLTNEQLIAEKYRGIRPAPGYPAQPDHTEKRTLFQLLDAEQATGITLTETYAMHPAASVSGLYFAHPAARYFAVNHLTRDQIESYAARKGMSLQEVERWLAPYLAYEPS